MPILYRVDTHSSLATSFIPSSEFSSSRDLPKTPLALFYPNTFGVVE